jgi:hypothetical protein
MTLSEVRSLQACRTSRHVSKGIEQIPLRFLPNGNEKLMMV